MTTYLFVLAGCVALVLSLALTIAVRRGLTLPGVKWWVTAGWLIGFGAILNGAQESLPAVIGHVIAMMLLISGAGSVLIGTQRFLDAPINFERIVLLCLLTVSLGAWLFGVVNANAIGRVAISNLLLALIAGLIAFTAHRYARGSVKPITRWVVWSLSVLCIVFLVRIVMVMSTADMVTSLSDFGMNRVTGICALLCMLVLGFCQFKLVHHKLRQIEWEEEFANTVSGAINAQGLEQMVHSMLEQGRMFSLLLIEPDQRAATVEDIQAARAWEKAQDAAPWLAVRGQLEANSQFGMPLNYEPETAFASTMQRQEADSALLNLLAAKVKELLREGSFVSQIPPNQLCVVLADCSLDDAYIVAERIRVAIEYFDASSVGFMPEHTISIGVTGPPLNTVTAQGTEPAPSGDRTGWQLLVARAAAALERAQVAGRNRIELAH